MRENLKSDCLTILIVIVKIWYDININLISHGGKLMAYIKGVDKNQKSFITNTLDEFINVNNPGRVIDAFVDV